MCHSTDTHLQVSQGSPAPAQDRNCGLYHKPRSTVKADTEPVAEATSQGISHPIGRQILVTKPIVKHCKISLFLK